MQIFRWYNRCELPLSRLNIGSQQKGRFFTAAMHSKVGTTHIGCQR